MCNLRWCTLYKGKTAVVIGYSKEEEKEAALIDFSAAWCGPCKMLAHVLEEVSEEMSESVSFYNIDVDENHDLAQQYGVTSIPTLVLLKRGEKADIQEGFQPKGGIVSFIKAQL